METRTYNTVGSVPGGGEWLQLLQALLRLRCRRWFCVVHVVVLEHNGMPLAPYDWLHITMQWQLLSSMFRYIPYGPALDGAGGSMSMAGHRHDRVR